MHTLRIALISLLIAACADGRDSANAVNLTIVSEAALSDELRARVTELTIEVTGVQLKSKSYSVAGLPQEERVQLLPTVTSGIMTITASVRDDRANLLGQGSVDVQLTGKVVDAALTLHLQQPPMIAITPSVATVTRTRTQSFSANLPVIWSVMGGDANGTIDANGLYTAPATPGGPFTIVATSPTDETSSGTAVVTVADYGVEVLAGKPGGWGGADGIGAQARFSGPRGLVSDQQGSIYVGDVCALRRFTIATALVETVGGISLCSDGSVDGQLGSDARFSPISALAYDSSTNTLWVAEQVTNNVRRVNLGTGAVTTLLNTTTGAPLRVGGLGGIAIDESNQILYLAAAGRHAIYKVPLASPTPTLFAGTVGAPGSANGTGSAASFNRPLGIAYGAGHLYVADSNNHTIRDIDVSNQSVQTLAGTTGLPGEVDGTGTNARFDGPQSVSLSTNGTTLFVGDAAGTVHSIALANASVTRIAGTIHPSLPSGVGVSFTPAMDANPGTAAWFGPVFVAADVSGAIYAGDMDSGVLRSITPGRFAVTTVAGSIPSYGYRDGAGAEARFWRVGSVASDGRFFYVAENTNAVIRKIDVQTGQVSTIAGAPGFYGGTDGSTADARFATPEGILLDGSTLYIADGTAATIRTLDLSTNVVSTIAGNFQTLGTADGVGIAARFGYPVYLVGDHQDHLFVTDALYPILRRMTLSSGQVDTVAGDAAFGEHLDGVGTAAHFSFPVGMAIENGVLYVCDQRSLRSVTLDNFTVATIAPKDPQGATVQLNGLQGCSGDGKGHVYLGDASVLRRFDVATQSITTMAGRPSVQKAVPGPLATATLNYITGIAFTTGGDLVLTDNVEGAVFLARVPQ